MGICTTLASNSVLSPPAKLWYEEAGTLPRHLPLHLQTNVQTRVHDGLPVPRRYYLHDSCLHNVFARAVLSGEASRRELGS
jgi:hypothetical protein